MSKATPELDAAVRRAYDDQPHAADRIFVTPEYRDAYLKGVRHLCPEATEVETLEHLERLRKRGADSGGLRRKRR